MKIATWVTQFNEFPVKQTSNDRRIRLEKTLKFSERLGLTDYSTVEVQLCETTLNARLYTNKLIH